MSQFRAKNHYVPECYLKRWADGNQQICVYRTLVSDEKVPVWRRYNASAIAYQKHLYTQVISGKESDELETWLDREFESPASSALDKVVSDKRLTVDDWAVLVKFLAAQDVRTPLRLIEHYVNAQKLIPEVLQKVLNDLKEELEGGEIDSLVGQDEYPNESRSFPLRVTTDINEGSEVGTLKAESYAGRATWIFSIKHFLNNTRKALHNHKWTIIKPAKGYHWFTSDNPVIRLNYYSPGKYDFKGGWGMEKGNIIFPIGPDHAMFVQIGDKPKPKGARLSEAQTRQIRKFIAENAYRRIFSNEFDKEVLILRPRIVNSEQLKAEADQMRKWHDSNSKMEREYLAKNRA